MEVDCIRRVGAGHDEPAGAHDIDDHLPAAAGRIGRRVERGQRGRRRLRHLRLNPCRIELEARIASKLRLGVEQAARADA